MHVPLQNYTFRPRTSSIRAPPSRGASQPTTTSASLKAKPQNPVSSLNYPPDRHTSGDEDEHVDQFKIDVGQTVQRLEKELDDVSITSPTQVGRMDTVSVGLEDIIPGATENMGSGEFTLYMYIHVLVCVDVLVGHCLATKVFIGKLPATGGVWLIIG